MPNLIATILCSTSIALILKFNHSKSGNPVVLISGNYAVAFLISFLFVILDRQADIIFDTVIFGAAVGVIFFVSFFAFAKAVSTAGTALATVSSRLSVFIPVLLSIFFFDENPGLFHIIGFLLTAVTIIIFYKALRSKGAPESKTADYIFIIILFIGIGLGDFSMKVFEQWKSPAEKSLFLSAVFGAAFFYSVIFIFIKKIKLERRTFLAGNILGIPNIFSSYFLIEALAEIPAIIVYPVVNIGIILLTALLAMLLFAEKIGFYAKLAVVLGIISIILLGL